MDQPQDEVSLSGEAESQLAEESAAVEPVVEPDPAVVEREELLREKAELQALLLRRQADYENSRRRAEKERIEHAEYAAMDAVKAFLPILDDFERALGVETADKEYARGIELIYQRTLDTLKKLGLEPMETQGAVFDPNVHHAIEMVNTEEAEDQTVLGEFQRGYLFKSKLLRPALVRVAVR
ncbi:MAG: nucleotide exchange factor GrpE [Bryobacterales bacterium]|nr:nucleotide exchange factor GrpE [Bryobacterales bacterium]